MSQDELFELLDDLAETRRLPTEIEALLEPFRGKTYTLSFRFVSASSTFANRFDSAYGQGKTLTCKMNDREATVFLLPHENEVVDALAADEEFERVVTLLDFDTLYQRGIFGQFIEETIDAEPQEDEATEEIPESTAEPQPTKPVGEPTREPTTTEPVGEPTRETPAKPREEPEPAPAAQSPAPEEPPKKKPAPTRQLKKKSQRKIRKIKNIGRKPKPSRFAKLKETKLFRIQDGIVKKMKRSIRTTCPNGHGRLTRVHLGKKYCKTCGWPSHRDRVKSIESSPPSEEKGPSCRSVAVMLIIAFIIMKSCVGMMMK